MAREQMKEVADLSWGQGPATTNAARMEWLLRCEAAIKSMAEQYLCPKTSPEQLVEEILKERR